MGQQQLLLVVLSVLIVAIAIALGLSLFLAESVENNKHAIVDDIINLSTDARLYRFRHLSMNGLNSFTGYVIPSKLATNDNAAYSVTAVSDTEISFLATSSQNISNTVSVQIGANGSPVSGSWSFNGDFQ